MTIKIDDKKMKCLIQSGSCIGMGIDRASRIDDIDFNINIIWSGHDYHSTKPIEKYMDKKYPHHCLKCKNQIRYEEVFEQFISTKRLNIFEYKHRKWKDIIDFEKTFSIAQKLRELRKQLKTLWLDDRIEFYCCCCYNRIEGDE